MAPIWGLEGAPDQLTGEFYNGLLVDGGDREALFPTSRGAQTLRFTLRVAALHFSGPFLLW